MRKLFILIFFFCISILTHAQLPADMSQIKSSDITDAQLKEFVQKAANSGLSEQQVIQEFTRRGMAPTEIASLKARIANLSQPEVESSNNNQSVGRTVNTNGASSAVGNVSTIFGSEMFSNPSNTFEPSINIPTPLNYTLAYGDKLLLDVFGINLSQQNLSVDPEGTVYIKYVGPIFVNGLTIEEASNRINEKLSKFYPSIRTGQTKAKLTLTSIRTIKVIVSGAVRKPGSYSISSLSSLYNALYLSGGPTENGSFRNIELIRNNKVILLADLYEFLLSGNQKNNVRIQDNDLIRIPFVKTKVTLTGEVNRSGIFEVQPSETLEDVIVFAGGYKSTAYKARVIGTRLTDFDKKILDITKDSISLFKPQNGDDFNVGAIINRFQNRVIIEGSVFKPGTYSFESGMTLQSLIKKAEGFKEDVYSARIIIDRTRSDLSKEYISVDLANNDKTDFLLAREDLVQVYSKFDIKDKATVTINGAVRKPGTFIFEDSLSLKSLILQAGGFAENATGLDIEISRRKKNVEVNNPNSPIVEIIRINDDKDLSKQSGDVQLKPFDVISIKVNPYYKVQINVVINGEVLIPGTYTLTSRVEKISDLIKRAGGTLYTANIAGARLRRRNNLYDVDLKIVNKIAESSARDSSGVTVETERRPYTEIAIDLPKILQNPGNKEDILLQEGDAIYVPTINNLVSISGEVFKPLEISFDETKTLRDYLTDAGGVTNSGNKKRIFVIYPNGKAAKIKHSLIFFRKYPEVTAGAKIFVPKEPEKKGTDYAKSGIIISAISAFITAIALAYQISK